MKEIGYTEIEPSKLSPHPLAEKFYGQKVNQEVMDPGILESIKDSLVIEPLVVKNSEKGYTILSGHQRWLGAEHLGIEKIPIKIVEFESEEEEKEVFLEADVTKNETFSMKMRRADMWEPLAKKKAEERRRWKGKYRSEPTEDGYKRLVKEDIDKSEKGPVREKLAPKFNWSPKKYYMARYIWRKHQEGEAGNLVEELDKGERSVNSAYKRLKGREKGRKVEALRDEETEGKVFDEEFSIEERAKLHNVEFPNYSQVHVHNEALYGYWLQGKAFSDEYGFMYGSYLPSYRKRIESMFKDCYYILHLFSGELKSVEENVVTFDIDEDKNPDVVGDARNILDYANDSDTPEIKPDKFDIIYADPFYRREDVEKYREKTGKQIDHLEEGEKDKIVSDCSKIVKPKGFMVWLGFYIPRWKSEEWKYRGMIGVTQGPGSRTRTCLILQKPNSE